MTKGMKLGALLLLLLVGAVAVAGYIKFNVIGDDMYLTQKDDSVVQAIAVEEYVVVGEDGTTGVFAYTSEEKDTATLDINGEFYQLARTESASGAKYTNEDESVTFWEKGGETMIAIAGEETRNASIEKADILAFHIAAYKEDCVGVGPMKCLVVNGELFYDSIAGFEFEEGTEYELTVARTERENVPADASAYQYRRVEVLKSNKQGDPNANKYDFGTDSNDNGEDKADTERCDVVDQDCTGDDDVSKADNTCGSGTVLEEGECVPEHRDDDDGDSIPTEDEASATDVTEGDTGSSSATTTEATDYNSSRSNKSL